MTDNELFPQLQAVVADQAATPNERLFATALIELLERSHSVWLNNNWAATQLATLSNQLCIRLDLPPSS